MSSARPTPDDLLRTIYSQQMHGIAQTIDIIDGLVAKLPGSEEPYTVAVLAFAVTLRKRVQSAYNGLVTKYNMTHPIVRLAPLTDPQFHSTNSPGSPKSELPKAPKDAVPIT